MGRLVFVLVYTTVYSFGKRRKIMKKRGKHINQNNCVLPLGIKRGQVWELPLHAALLALSNGEITQGHFDDLRTLSEITRRTTEEAHLLKHAESLERILKPIGQRGGFCTGNEAVSIKASVRMLLDHVTSLNNHKMVKAAMGGIRV